MPSALLREEKFDTVPLGDSGWLMRRADLAAEQRFWQALQDLTARPCRWEFQPDAIAAARAHFLTHKTARLEPGEGEEQARLVFDELARPHCLSLISGPPGAAKTTAASLWVELAQAHVADLPIIVVTQEKTALQRLVEKLKTKPVLALTLREALTGQADWPHGACVIVDEAGLLGTADLGALLHRAAQTGAERVLLIGDDRQSLPQSVGQPFRYLRESGLAHHIECKSPYRQKTPRLRRAVQAIYGGDLAEALGAVQPEFVAHTQLTNRLRARLHDCAPDKTLVIAHLAKNDMAHWPMLLGGYRVLSLQAAQGLAVDRVVFVIGKTLNRADFLVGCSRQRYELDVLVDQAAYADGAALAAAVADWPRVPMALDMLGGNALLQIKD